MFGRTGSIIESTLDELKQEVMNAEDYATVRRLMEIESELDRKVSWTYIKGIIRGYGTAMVGVTIGTVIVKNVKSNRT